MQNKVVHMNIVSTLTVVPSLLQPELTFADYSRYFILYDKSICTLYNVCQVSYGHRGQFHNS